MADEGAARKAAAAPRTGLARYQYPINILLIGNALAAAYWLLTREETPKKSPPVETSANQPAADVSSVPASNAAAAADAAATAIHAAAAPLPAMATTTQVSEDEQVEIYKWMLAEKRKLKPSSSQDKARIDTEKALLKDYIRGKLPFL